MPFTIPNAQSSPTYQAQAVLDSTDLTTLANIGQNYGVVSGLTVTPGGGYTVNVAAGVISTQVIDTSVAAVTGLAPSAASSTDRRDIVVCSPAGVVSIVAGTPTTETAVPWTNTSVYNPPVKPAVPAGYVLLAEIYIPGGGGTIASGWITDKTTTSYQSQVPNSSRLIDWGHSWVAPPPYPYATSNLASQDILGNLTHPWSGNQWPNALRDALGIGSGGVYYKTYTVPATAAGTTATSNIFLDYMPDDGTIDAVYYIPNGALTGANTNTRGISVGFQTWLSYTPLNVVNFVSGVNMVQGSAVRVFSMNDNTGVNSAASATAGGASTPELASPYLPALRSGLTPNATPLNQEIYWQQIKVGTGNASADPGGQVIIRYGTRYRNYAVGGASLLGQGGVATASWQTTFSWSGLSRPNAIEVNLTATSNSGTTSLTCSALPYPIKSGSVINFAGGLTATTTATAYYAQTSITVSSLGSTLAAGLQGHVQYKNGLGTGAYESLSPSVNVWTHGVNDADATTQDVPAWTETVRACIARNNSSAMDYASEGNFVTTNGGGTWAAMAAPPAGGALPYLLTPGSIDTPLMWTGTVSGSPKVVISIGPGYEGGVVDIFLLAIAGSSKGVAGTVTVDGATPPQGSVTFNTSGVSTSGLATRSSTATSFSVSSTTLTASGGTPDFTSADIGKMVTFTGGTGSCPAGTYITAVASTSSATLSAAATTASATACSIAGYYPMVKRLTGLAAGAHTITLTITGSDSTTNSALILMGLGIEPVHPTGPVLWCNIARTPSQTSGQKTNSVALNTASQAVINGTASALSGNTAEPSLGTNVQYVDIDTLFGGASPTTNYFLPDGLHLNSYGHRLMAKTLFAVMRNSFTPDQLMAR